MWERAQDIDILVVVSFGNAGLAGPGLCYLSCLLVRKEKQSVAAIKGYFSYGNSHCCTSLRSRNHLSVYPMNAFAVTH